VPHCVQTPQAPFSPKGSCEDPRLKNEFSHEREEVISYKVKRAFASKLLATEPLLHLKSDMQSGVISGGLKTLSRGLHCFTRWLVCAGLVHLPYLCPELYPDVKPETACLHVLPRGGGGMSMLRMRNRQA
jgi:hypothetical protein